MADRKAHKDGAGSVERKVGNSWKLLPDSIQGRLGVGHVMNLKYDEACFTEINLRMQSRLQNISHVQKKGDDYFDRSHDCQIISNSQDFKCRIRMSYESFIDKCMDSCDSKGSTIRAALRNPVINSDKFDCPSCKIMLHLNGLGIEQQGQR